MCVYGWFWAGVCVCVYWWYHTIPVYGEIPSEVCVRVCICLDGIVTISLICSKWTNTSRHPRPTGHSPAQFANIFFFLRDWHWARTNHKGTAINWIVFNIMICTRCIFFVSVYLFLHQFFWRLCAAINILYFHWFVFFVMKKNNHIFTASSFTFMARLQNAIAIHARTHAYKTGSTFYKYITFMMVNGPFILIFHPNSLYYFR